MEELALKDFVVTARRFTACGCPATENQQIGVTYVRPESTPTTRPIHLQAACSSLGQSVPCKCDRCKALTVAVHSIDGTPEYIALETPRHRVTTEGEIVTDEDFPGPYQESLRPIYVNGLPYHLPAVICTKSLADSGAAGPHLLEGGRWEPGYTLEDQGRVHTVLWLAGHLTSTPAFCPSPPSAV